MIDQFARTLVEPLVRQATGSARVVVAAAEATAMRGARRLAAVLVLAVVACAALVVALAFLAFALHREIAAVGSPVLADIVVGIVFLVVGVALLLALGSVTRVASPPPPPPPPSFAPTRGPREGTGHRGRARPAATRAAAPRDETDADDEAAAPERRAEPPAAVVAGAMGAALLLGILLGRR